ncbi:MAG: hypothetical protein DIU60_012020, partial [Actinomycetes bacterium]
MGAAITTAAGLGMSTPADAAVVLDRTASSTVQITCSSPVVLLHGTSVRLFQNVTANDSAVPLVCILVQDREQAASAAEKSETGSSAATTAETSAEAQANSTSTVAETKPTEAEGTKAAAEAAKAESAKNV